MAFSNPCRTMMSEPCHMVSVRAPASPPTWLFLLFYGKLGICTPFPISTGPIYNGKARRHTKTNQFLYRFFFVTKFVDCTKCVFKVFLKPIFLKTFCQSSFVFSSPYNWYNYIYIIIVDGTISNESQ